MNNAYAVIHDFGIIYTSKCSLSFIFILYLLHKILSLETYMQLLYREPSKTEVATCSVSGNYHI